MINEKSLSNFNVFETTTVFSEVTTPFKSLHNGLKEIGFSTKKQARNTVNGVNILKMEKSNRAQDILTVRGRRVEVLLRECRLWRINYYKDGRPVRKWKEYFETGKLKRIGSYKNGKRSGKWKRYSQTTASYKDWFFKHGKRVGEWQHYYNNGNLKKTIHYQNGNIIKTEIPEEASLSD